MSKKTKLAGALLGAVISTSTMAMASNNSCGTGKCGAGKCGGNMKKEMNFSTYKTFERDACRDEKFRLELQEIMI